MTVSGIVPQRYGGTEVAGSVFLTSVILGSKCSGSRFGLLDPCQES